MLLFYRTGADGRVSEEGSDLSSKAGRRNLGPEIVNAKRKVSFSGGTKRRQLQFLW